MFTKKKETIKKQCKKHSTVPLYGNRLKDQTEDQTENLRFKIYFKPENNQKVQDLEN